MAIPNPWNLSQLATPTNLLGAAGVIGNYITGNSAANAQKEAARRQAQLIQLQAQNFKTAQPAYGQLVQAYAQRAGLGQPAGQGVGPGGVFGTPEDAARFRAFEEFNNRSALQNQNRLSHDLANRGIASGSLAAAFAQNERARQGATSNFGRQLQIMAPQEQERRLGLLQNAVGMGFGQGGAASAGYGQQAGMYGQQAAGAFGNINNIAQQYMYGRQLGQQPPVTADIYGLPNITPEEAQPAYYADLPWWQRPVSPYGYSG
jgi:hypothetical protein